MSESGNEIIAADVFESVPVMTLHGRRVIEVPNDVIDENNIVEVLSYACAIHEVNRAEIEYLDDFRKGIQPILNRHKKVRPEINNKIVENHADEIAGFTAGYFLGEPVTYVTRGERENLTGEIDRLNDYMEIAGKETLDMELADWLAVCGVGYRMVSTNPNYVAGKNAPFILDTLNPARAFVVYNSGFGRKPVLGVQQVYRNNGSPFDCEIVNCCYTETRYFEVSNGVLDPNSIRDNKFGVIPIFEYRLNRTLTGSFELAVPLLNSLNNLASNRVDGVEQLVQSFLKFKNVDFADDDIKKIGEIGAIKFKTMHGVDGDVEYVAVVVDQTQTQNLVDYILNETYSICGVPKDTKNGGSTQDSGSAVILRNGWETAEVKARVTEKLFKRSERQFLGLVIDICKSLEIEQKVSELKLSVFELDCKFTRRQHDNLQSKAQVLLTLLNAGVAPKVAIESCGIFNDPTDVFIQSEEFLKKWDYIDMTGELIQNTPHEEVIE